MVKNKITLNVLEDITKKIRESKFYPNQIIAS